MFTIHDDTPHSMQHVTLPITEETNYVHI